MGDLHHRFSQSMLNIFGLFPPRKIGVAVSGGVDSIALTSLLSPWARARGIDVNAYIADHKLRDNSSDEAEKVATYLRSKFNMETHILQLTGLKGLDNQENPDYSKTEKLARDARRDAFRVSCASDSISHLLMAHHEDDQVELFIQRLIAGSSWVGLAGMQRCGPSSLVRPPPDRASELSIVRPLLDIPKSSLYDLCRNNGLQWWEDPTNKDIFLTIRNLIRRMYSLDRAPPSVARPQVVSMLQLFGAQRDKVYNAADCAYKQLLHSQQLALLPKEASAKLTLSNDLRELPLVTLSELLFRIVAPISPLPGEKILNRRRKLDAVAQELQKNTSKPVFNVLKVSIKKVGDEILTFSRENPRLDELDREEIFKANPEWSKWTLIDNRWYMRWKLPDGSKNQERKYFAVRLISDPEPLLEALTPSTSSKDISTLRKKIPTHPFFTWCDVNNENATDAQRMIGFPTLGITASLDIEVQPKTCVF